MRSVRPLTASTFRFGLFLLVALAAGPALAQGRLAFDAEALDFGRMAEAEGPVTHTFRFTNAGDAPLRLVRVEASCGCTTPAWSRDAVGPGEGGLVEVAYDPAGRPGPFEKTVFVQAEGAEPAAVTLRIEGVVQPALAQTGVPVGAFAFNTVEADAGVVRNDDGFQLAFQFANVGDRPVRIDSVSAPEGVEVVFPARPLFPDGLGGLFVNAETWQGGRRTAGHGFEMDLVLHTDDAAQPDKRLRVVGRVEVHVRQETGQVDGE